MFGLPDELTPSFLARLEKLNPQNDNLAQLREELDKSRRGAAPSTNGDGGKGRKKSPTD